MTTLVPVDGSHSSQEALLYVARTRPQDDVLLLHVAPSAREVDLERGRFLLEDGRRTCRELSPELGVEVRLEIGDRAEQLNRVAEETGADLIVLGAHGVNALPKADRVSPQLAEWSGGNRRPVVRVQPDGAWLRWGRLRAGDGAEFLSLTG
ncbi:MAG: universal stress protein [Armatimonadetes bacterium]|nr:universal stress protein [Armatimonadota bacterium]